MKKTWELLLKETIIVVLCTITCVTTLAMAYLIPQDEMWDNVHESSVILHNEGLGAHIWQNIEETMLDVYTDGLLFNVSYTETKDGIRDILLDTYVEVDGKNPMESFYEVIALSNDDYIVRNYGRYWHGYQIILRPLLCFFTYSDIRQINMILQLALVFLLICILAGSKDRIFIIPFGGMYLFICPISLFSSLQFSPCFYIMMLTLIVLFACKDVLNDKRRNYLFLMAGILTAYFDLLTYPFITLGVPLLAHLGSAYKQLSDDKMRGWNHVFFSTISWCLGYGGMWSAKWVISTIMTGENIVYDAFEKIKFRSGYFSVKHSYYDTLKLNLSVCNRKVFMLAAISIGIYILAVRVKDHIGLDRSLLSLSGMLLVVSLYPFGWYFFTKNHSSSHSYFTWRELGISVYGILMISVIRIRQFRESFSV